MSSVQYEARFEKSVARLKAMGIKLYVDASDPENAYIFMDTMSIIAFIDKHITYPTSETWIDGKYMITHVWKGDKNSTGIQPPENAIVLHKAKPEVK